MIETPKLLKRFVVSQILVGVFLIWANISCFDKPEDLTNTLLQWLLEVLGVLCVGSGLGLLKAKKWAYYACSISSICIIGVASLVILFCMFLLGSGKIKGQDFIGLFIVLPLIILLCAHGISLLVYVNKQDVKNLFLNK